MPKYFELTFDIPCGVIQAKVWGKVGGKPLLGLHGWLDNAGTFDKLAPMLSEDVHFVAIDLPGHGKSSHKPKGVTSYDWLVDIKRVITQLGWEKFSMLCHSMSASYGLLYAGTFPDEVEKLILLDGIATGIGKDEAPELLANHIKAMLEETRPRRVYPDLSTITAKLQQDIQRLNGDGEQSARILVTRGAKEVEGGYMFTWDPSLRHHKPPRYMFLSNPLEFRFADYISFYKRVSCRVLLIFASETERKMKHMLKYVEDNKLAFDTLRQNGTLTIRLIPGNHYVHLNNPHVIMPLVNSFLSASQTPHSHSISKL